MQKIANGLMQNYDFEAGMRSVSKESAVFIIFDFLFNKNELDKAMMFFNKLLETNPEVHTNLKVMHLFTMMFLNELVQLNMVVNQVNHEIFLAMAHLMCKFFKLRM